jgi:capsular polysaccharide biosynthesis protein
MDLMESIRTLRRRWILTSVLLLLALAGTVAAFVKLPPTYQGESMTVFLSSKNAAKQAGGNPYLAFNSSLTLTADVVRREIMDPRTAQDLKQHGFGSSYLVAAATDTAGPVLLITTTGSNKSQVEQTLNAVANEVGAKLTQLQVSIDENDRIGYQVVSTTPTATLNTGKKARPLAMVLALGLVLTFAIPQVVDARASRRRKKSDAVTPERERVNLRLSRATTSVGGHSTDEVLGNGVPVGARAKAGTTLGSKRYPDDSAPASRSRFR